MIGDVDPEDAYDATDPTPVRLDVLERVIYNLETDRLDPRWDRRRIDALRLVADLAAEIDVDRIRLGYVRDALEGFVMGGRYLTDLADVCRSAGLHVIEMEGWQSRARGSGGFNAGKPDHVMAHHTASGASSDGWPDAEYCTHGDDGAPLTNLYINRAGSVWVCAGGATNTNGSGDCVHLPADTMNTSAVGIEAGNDGVGETWPDVQQDAYMAVVRALCTAYVIPSEYVHSHAEWAPTRKVDPAGPSRWSTGGTWNMEEFRSELVARPEPPEVPDLTDDQNQKLLDVWAWIQQLTKEDGWPHHPDFRASIAAVVDERLAAHGLEKS